MNILVGQQLDEPSHKVNKIEHRTTACISLCKGGWYIE